ncbi:MAG: hypothetical protein ACLGHZ_04635 [Actinomycetes bacterium]
MFAPPGDSAGLLYGEARSLLARIDQLRPMALNETMVPAAGLPAPASLAMERFLHSGRTLLREQVHRYLVWLTGPGQDASASLQQRRFVAIRMRFNAILSQLDLFAEVVSQRSEHQIGVWLAGLDILAEDALAVNRVITEPPPLVCYVARGPGAAIRRARTRLPGGDANPVAIVRVPRERMVGQGIASSLCHEVGHQGAALLGLVESLRPEIARVRQGRGRAAPAWVNWERWLSEVVADFWSVATLGISSTLGLFAVVSLPRYFVFRPSGDDPHPVPYVRVLLSAAIGNTLFPHPQWARIASIWKEFYPTDDLPAERQDEFALLEQEIPAFTALLAGHTSPRLAGRSLASLFPPRRTRAEESRRAAPPLAGRPRRHGERVSQPGLRHPGPSPLQRPPDSGGRERAPQRPAPAVGAAPQSRAHRNHLLPPAQPGVLESEKRHERHPSRGNPIRPGRDRPRHLRARSGRGDPHLAPVPDSGRRPP